MQNDEEGFEIFLLILISTRGAANILPSNLKPTMKGGDHHVFALSVFIKEGFHRRFCGDFQGRV